VSKTGLLSVASAAKERDALSSEQKRQLVQRVISSAALSRSSSLCSFLLFITEHAISGQASKLKEQIIGAEVLGRRADYDPAVDNIVRVRARELRGRLDRYFATDGKDEPMILTVPKGSYVPEFVLRNATPANAEPPLGHGDRTATAPEPSLRRHWWRLAAMFLITILLTVALTILAVRPDRRASLVPSAGALRDFWGQFFDKPNEELKIVYADTSFALWQDLNGKTLNLGDYLGHGYLAGPDDKLLEVAARRATSPADITVSLHLAALAGEFGGQVNAQFARNANAEFFHRGNVVLLGSRRSNPWIQVYEPYLNFELRQDPQSRAPIFRNRSPQPHEAAQYAIPASLDDQGAEEREMESYGVIALLKDCGGRGLVVLDEGLNMQATQAGGDEITDPQRLDTLLRSIGHKPGTTVSPFEALIQIRSLPGGYDAPRVIAYRLHPEDSCVNN